MREEEAALLSEAEESYRRAIQVLPRSSALPAPEIADRPLAQHACCCCCCRALCPSSSLPPPPPLAADSATRAPATLGLGRQLSGVEGGLRSDVREWSSYTLARNNLGLALYRRGRLDEAEAEFLTALRFSPEHPNVRFNLGLLQAAREQTARAAEEAKQRKRKKRRADEAEEEEGIRIAGQDENAPPGARRVNEEDLSAELLLRLFEEALGAQPANAVILAKARSACKQHAFACSSSLRSLLQGPTAPRAGQL